MQEVWIHDDRIVYVKYNDGSTKCERGRSYDEPVRFRWLPDRFIIDQLGKDSVPVPGEKNFLPEPEFVKDPVARGHKSDKAIDKLYDLASSIAGKLDDMDLKPHEDYLKVHNSDKIGCCLPVHHGYYVEAPRVDAVIDEKLAAMVSHVSNEHPEKLSFLTSCQGGPRNHIVSQSVETNVGHLMITGPETQNIVEAFGPLAFFADHDVVNNYPEWVVIAIGVSPHGVTIAWNSENGLNTVKSVILSKLCSGESCSSDIKFLENKVSKTPCDYCLSSSDLVKLAI